MKIKWYKQLSLVVIIAMLASMLPVYAAAAESVSKQATVFHFVDNSNAKIISLAQTFFSKYQAFTYEVSGHKYFEITVPKLYDLTLTIEGRSGEVLEETTDYTVRKYEVSAYEVVLPSVTAYTMPDVGAHAPAVRLIIGNDIDGVKADLETELEKAKKLESPSLANAITVAEAANTYLTLKAAMATALANLRTAIATHDTGEPTGPSEPEPSDPDSVTDADLKRLETALAAARAVAAKDIALETTISEAEVALENKELIIAELDAHIARLNYLVSINSEVVASLKTVTIDYVKSTELNTLFNESYKSFFSNAQTFEASGKKYLRMQVEKKFDLKLTVEGKVGQVANYIGNTAVVYDYELSSLVEPILSAASYVAGPRVNVHEQYMILNPDATAADRAALKAAITTAKAIQKQTASLSEALAAAEEVDNLLTRKAALNVATAALEAAIEENRVVNEDDLKLLKTALKAAGEVATKDIALVTAISEAEAALENEELIIAELKALIARLNYLVSINSEVVASLKTVTIDYVKSTDFNTLFNESYKSFFSNAQTFEANGKKYLRMQVEKKFDLKLTVEGKVGQVANYIGNTAVVYDYELSSLVEPILSAASYVAGPRVNVHEQYMILNPDATAADRAALKAAIATAKAIQKQTASLSEALAAAEEIDNLLTRKAALNVATAALEAAIEENRVVNEDDLKLLKTALTAAREVATKDIALVTAISEAEAALENEELIIAELKAHIARLNHLVSINSEVVASLKTVTIDYVKSTDLNTSFNENYKSFFSNAQTFEANGKKYLRMQVEKKFDLKLTVEGKVGQVANYIGNTAVVYDYELSSLVEPILSVTSYVAGSRVNVHEQYMILNPDATAADRAALKAAIATAKAIVEKTTSLSEALAVANKVDNLLTRKAVLVSVTKTLNDAIAANNSTTGTNPSKPIIHEGSGLEVGTYMVSVSALKDTSNEVSYMNSYLKGMARLLVTEKSLTVYVVLNSASMIKGLSVGGTSAGIVDHYTAANVARYAFSVSSLTAPTDASIHVIATLPDGTELYNTTHGIRFAFGTPTKVAFWPSENYDVNTDKDELELEEDPKSNSGESTGNNNGSTTPVIKFTDISNSWAKAAIERAVSLKLVNGYSDGTFKPSQQVNRAEFTAILVRAMKLEAAKGEVKFADADKIQGWAKAFIQQAVEAGILKGYTDNTFRPTGSITRVEAAVMIVRALDLELVSEDELTFADAASIPAYARAYVATAVKYGLVTGYSNNTFAPGKVATRADAITLAIRALDYKEAHK